MDVAYSRYEEAYRAIHSALMNLTAPPPGRKITKIGFTWQPDGTLASLQAKDGADVLFVLNFSWDAAGNLVEVART